MTNNTHEAARGRLRAGSTVNGWTWLGYMNGPMMASVVDPDLAHELAEAWNAYPTLVEEHRLMEAALRALVRDAECYCADEYTERGLGPCPWHEARAILDQIEARRGQ